MNGPQVLLLLQGGQGQTVTPGTAALTLTAFAPTVLTPRLVTVGKATLTTTTFVPAVAAPRLVTVGKVSLTLTTFAPTVTASSGVSVIPGTASLALTGFAPVVSGTQTNVGGRHAVGVITFERPRKAQPVTVEPLPALLLLTTYQPTVVVNDDELVIALAA